MWQRNYIDITGCDLLNQNRKTDNKLAGKYNIEIHLSEPFEASATTTQIKVQLLAQADTYFRYYSYKMQEYEIFFGQCKYLVPLDPQYLRLSLFYISQQAT